MQGLCATMGIHGEWMKVFKETCPEAFTARLTGRPRGAFIDGQIQLMKSAHVLTWDQFVHSQFAMPVRRMLREHGATSVVLAFDDYTHVPLAKGMTQAQRQKKTSPKAFHARQQLPDMIPDDWEHLICNRAFKKRVIEMVIARLPLLVELDAGEELIIDYMGHPMCYRAGARAVAMPELEPMGEADLKFFRYAERYGSLLAMATDSDYVPISLLRLHTQFRGAGAAAPRVVILRLRTSLPSDKESRPAVPKDERPRREYEFVDTNVLLAGLVRALCATAGLREETSIENLCAVIALFGGTDFTRAMPSVGPRRAWASLRAFAPALLKGFDGATGQCVVSTIVDGVVGKAYGRVYAKHVCGARGICAVVGALQASKLSAVTKQRLPSVDFVQTCVRNTNWVLLYWRGDYAHELSGDFGYKSVGARVTYADLG